MAAPLDERAFEPQLVSEERIFPPGKGTQTVVPLSILDCTTVRFALTCAAWIYSAPTTETATRASDPTHLLASFKHTLASYPQWAGQLFWNTYDPTNSSGHTHRHGRIAIKYGAGHEGGEPGVGFYVAKHPARVAQLVPSATERSTTASTWQIDAQLPSHTLLAPTLVAFQDNIHFLGLPGVAVQVTQFADGGYAVGIKMCHALADATSLVGFMHDWATVNRAMAAREPVPTLGPVFDPAMLDAKAAGDIDASSPDLAIVEKVRKLPLHRYDWFLSGGPACPPFFLPFTTPPPDLDISCDAPHVRGIPIPWQEWDMSVPVTHTIIHFSAGEILKMHARATEDGKHKLSKLDALLGHVWGCILRARDLRPDEPTFLDMTFGFRSRLGLPPTLLGSPIRLAAVPRTGANTATDLARAIRTTLAKLDGTTCSLILHEQAHEPTPQNIWATFLGRNHTLTTSWTRLGLYAVDFAGDGKAPRYVDATMPPSDGLLQISESAPVDGLVPSVGTEDWTRDGASVSLHLRVDVMGRLCADPLLREYASAWTRDGCE